MELETSQWQCTGCGSERISDALTAPELADALATELRDGNASLSPI